MLVAGHLVLGILPVLSGQIPPDVRLLPLIWAPSSLSISQIMLLAFWAGMGKSRAAVRLLGLVAGIGYATAWLALAEVFSPYSAQESDFGQNYAGLFGVGCGMAVMFTGLFLIMRRWWFDLRRLNELDAPPPSRFQYSLLHVLVIASLVCVTLALMQKARRDIDQPLTQSHTLALNALALLIFLVNVFCAVRATLGAGAAALPIFLSLLTAALLALALALGIGHDRLGWWVFAGSVLVLSLPAAILIASLLVVRSSGYRLMPKKG
jgi:hypothetical protein